MRRVDSRVVGGPSAERFTPAPRERGARCTRGRRCGVMEVIEIGLHASIALVKERAHGFFSLLDAMVVLERNLL